MQQQTQKRKKNMDDKMLSKEILNGTGWKKTEIWLKVKMGEKRPKIKSNLDLCVHSASNAWIQCIHRSQTFCHCNLKKIYKITKGR